MTLPAQTRDRGATEPVVPSSSSERVLAHPGANKRESRNDGEPTLEAILDAARKRELARQEIDLLCAYAREAGQANDVVLALLQAGTAAARTNLLAARVGLLGSNGPRRRQASVAATTIDYTPPGRGNSGYLDIPGAPFAVTQHAFERYAQRYASDDLEAAAVAFAVEVAGAGPIRERALTGDELWRGPTGVMFVVKRDGSDGSDRARATCVTVLAPDAGRPRRRAGKPR